jgi:Transport protein Avl9
LLGILVAWPLTEVLRPSSNLAGLRLTSLSHSCANSHPTDITADVKSTKFTGLPWPSVGPIWQGSCLAKLILQCLTSLHVQDAFFQPYLPLQQLDLIKSRSFLCGSTNAIVRQQNDIELLVDVEECSVEFRDPKIERAVALTPADRKWVDEIVKDVNDTWDTEDPGMR